MSTCKFFLQGTCKFGDNCKFSHQINDNTQFHGTSIMRSHGKPSTVDTNLLIKSVVNDMINAEKGGHWLLSSYAPFKDKPYFPGFENRSFEEVRYGYYEAMKNGTVEQYKQQLQIALQSAVMRMKALQNPTSDVISIITQIYNSPIQNQNSTRPFTQSNSIFGQNQSSFDQNQAQPSIFAVANQKLFGNLPGQQQSMFGGSQMNTNSIFSGTPQQNTNQNIFGGNQSIYNKQQAFGNSSNSIFANQKLETSLPLNANKPFKEQNNTFMMQNNVFSSPHNTYSGNNMFNSQAKPFQSSSVSPFSNQGQAPNNSIFSNQNQPFGITNMPGTSSSQSPLSGQNQQQSIFANTGQQNIVQTSPSIQQQSVFTNTSQQSVVQTSPFIQQQQQTKTNENSIFNPSITQNSIFGGQASIFGSQAENTVQKLTNPIFQQSSSQASNIVGGNSAVMNMEAYSKLEDLSESDIKSFQSEHFEFGKIPEKPPTAQMCM